MKELKFVRLRNNDDIVGYVTLNDDGVSFSIETPLIIDVETIPEEGKQLIALREYIPQSIVDMREITMALEDVVFMEKTRPEFEEEFFAVAEMFYETTPRIRSSKKKKGDGESMTADKVISLLDALAEKKDKPVH